MLVVSPSPPIDMQCHLCEDFSVPTRQLLNRHIGRVHGNSHDFHVSCGFENSSGARCETTFNNFHAYKRHLRQKHREEVSECTSAEDEQTPSLSSAQADSIGDLNDPPEEPCYLPESQQDCPPQSLTNNKNFHREAALWILKLKEGRKLTQSAVDEILSDVTELCTNVVCQLGDDLRGVLKSSNVNPDGIPGLNALINQTSPYASPFANIKTQYLQLSYYRKHLNFVVSDIYPVRCKHGCIQDPVQITLGTYFNWTGEGPSRRLTEVDQKYTYIPILEVLKNMLNCPAVYEEVRNQ